MNPESLVETWNIHDRIHRYLLDAIPAEHLADVLFPKGRTVADLFGHIHNVRLMWLKSAAPERLDRLAKVERGSLDKATLSAALAASGGQIAGLIGDAAADDGRNKGFKPHVTAFVGYLISHESHHRGQIEWALRHAGHAISDKTSFGLWEWGTR